MTLEPAIEITDLLASQTLFIQQIADLLVSAFVRSIPTVWDMEAAVTEVQESLGPDRISRVALRAHDEVVGWVGGIRAYNGNAYELHPLVVKPSMQRRGIGRRLVADLESIVSQLGATTLWLGCDDEHGRTSLSGVDLYPDPSVHVRKIRNLGGHPFEFYQKLGYAIIGVLPDANGCGKPDILMSKRVGGAL